MIQPKLREYQTKDEQILKVLIGELHDHMVATDPIKRIRHQPGYIELQHNKIIHRIKEQSGKIFLAENDDVVVGFVVATKGMPQSAEKLLEVIPSVLGLITDLYVRKKYRRLGIGVSLLKKAERYLKSIGCDSIWIEIFAPNKDAWSFYHKQGYINREVGLLKKISV